MTNNIYAGPKMPANQKYVKECIYNDLYRLYFFLDLRNDELLYCYYVIDFYGVITTLI